MVDASVIEELLPFLSPATRQDVRNTALQHVVGTTATRDGREALGTHIVPCAEALGELIRASGSEGIGDPHVKQCYHALVNLTSEDTFAEKLARDLTFIPYLLQTVVDPSSQYAQPACMILSNLTRTLTGSKRVLSILESENESQQVGMNKLIEAFCLQGYNKKNSCLDFVGPLLANLTQLSEARTFVLDRNRCTVQRLLPYTQYIKSEVRRRGVVTALKNCCFDIASHEWLLGDQVDILPHLLLPLAGPEELSEEDMEGMPDDLQYLERDKQREEDPEIRIMLLEAVYQLCATAIGRQIVKEKRTYVIFREFMKWEKDPKVEALCRKVIDVLIMDDPEPGMENLNEVEIPEKVKVQLEKGDQEED
ncbi:protein HGH1 homolog [Diadema antillarum]|uniref:protein HGH1 homolog n=1 Tax=Diadema antillarum TaxID=105358 RepID=UPI003A87A0C5